ncbi:MAG: hypothetical protein ACI8Y8_003876, partial [Planctomycetota bacterium]
LPALASLTAGAGAPAPAPPPPQSEPRISARLEAAKLEVGPTYEIILQLDLPEGLTNANAKIAPVLQIDVPEGVTLDGKVFSSYEDLAGNEFLQMPYERALSEFPARIGFRLDSLPATDAVIGLNLVAYLVDGSGQHSFLRRRLDLALTPGASAIQVDASRSDWGNDPTTLQIGQRAADFELPRADGSIVGLTDYIGEKNIIITTYRAFW